MNLGQLLAHIITGAINQDPVCIQKLKLLLQKDPSRQDPHVFWVKGDGLILDSLKTKVEQRREVMPNFPRLGAGSVLKTQLAPECVVFRIRPFPSLVALMASMAFASLDQMQTRLIIDEGLSPTQRNRLNAHIDAITSPTRAVWENWILSLQKPEMTLIDRAVQNWLDEPIDWSEKHLFKPDWEDPLVSVKSAKAFFEQFNVEHRVYLGIKTQMFTQTSTGKDIYLETLDLPVDVANQRASTLGVKCRFKAI